MSRRIPILALLLLLIPLTAQSTHHVWPMAEGQVASPAVVLDPSGLVVVAWSDAGVVTTTAFHGDQFFGEDVHGPGYGVELCWQAGRIILAWYDDGQVSVREWDFWGSGDWSDAATFADTGSSVMSLSLIGWQPALTVEDAYLTWDTADGWIRYAQRNPVGDWTPAIHIVQQSPGFDPLHPTIVPLQFESLVTPRLYYLELESIYYRDGIWGAPVAVPGNYGVDFEVAAGPLGQHGILSLGVQPVCPCNTIWYVEQNWPGDWGTPVELTQNLDDYVWPRFPGLGIGADGLVHAFWFQRMADNMMTPTFDSLHYFVRDGVAWSDESAELQGHVGDSGDLAMDDWGTASMVWREPGDPDSAIWLASSALIGASEPAPAAFHELALHPNPFNPSTTIRFTLPEAAPVTLIVQDVSGRRVRELARDRHQPAGEVRVEWDGRDDAGRALPSGVYLLRFEAMGQASALRAVLLK